MQTRQATSFRPDCSRSSSIRLVLASPTAEEAATASSKKRTRRQCSRTDCSKVDAGGGFCVAHGGGKKCSFPGCTKGYQTGGFCRQHGGGARCQVSGCNKVDAGKGLCRAHGGGKRCQIANCSKADVGGGFCTAHGGGRRCSEQGCFKIDQGGGKCRAHGGARRCRRRNCQQPARGASGLCTEHGGARVCSVLSCRRLVRSPNDTGTMCAMCIRSQKQKEASVRIQQDNRNCLSKSPTLEGSGPSLMASISPVSPSSANLRCDGTQIANCLDNGCSRSYGGECNCVAGCTCNSSTLRAATRLIPMLTTRNVVTHVATSTSSIVTSSLCESKGLQGSIDFSAPRSTMILRSILRITPHSTSIGIKAILALLSSITGVMSVHLLLEHGSRQFAPSSGIDSGDVTADSRPHTIDSPRLVAVRGCQKMNLETSLVLFDELGFAEFTIIEQSASAWTRKEVVLRVPDMMCPTNCGTSVLNAARALEGVEAAKLHFQHRRIIVRGDMDTNAIQSALTDIGFDSEVDAETLLPRRFRFRVDDLSDVGLNGVKLKDAFMAVEGVENVVLLTDRVEVLVVAMLLDSNPLLQAAKNVGFNMLELSEEAWGIPIEVAPDPLGSYHSGKITSSSEIEKSDYSHKCDMRICPQNGCQRYMTTVAHTAALAVGWAVPGCGMAIGGECTCGDSCKCVGCPEHNPVS
ncbi:Heavy metal-associated domain, HMA [Plasmopara halstedii]|uniref:Heavy metal-associated domain, HMA n=1 Tax=Plasmopara halstedii TaxID=4781 RepID=A0A0N7L414_PLAHL|nr:Heavy metal-associated domain, HMA [Plasmopara halstedii]CEG37403.1 Heavy metal-associated domain, HMA [Plasmopara halstedii]|eukprot:XP_024573772.1 Heavy metal-associated domain, HMA [Plasmopara halstedii]